MYVCTCIWGFVMLPHAAPYSWLQLPQRQRAQKTKNKKPEKQEPTQNHYAFDSTPGVLRRRLCGRHQQHESGPTLETVGLAADVEAHAVLVSAAVLLVCCCVPGLLLCAVCCVLCCAVSFLNLLGGCCWECRGMRGHRKKSP